MNKFFKTKIEVSYKHKRRMTGVNEKSKSDPPSKSTHTPPIVS